LLSNLVSICCWGWGIHHCHIYKLLVS
jgi:hypothetical protein